jgi:hypothetical protein
LKKEKTETDPKKKEKLKSTACVVFGCFAGHRRRRETEKKKSIQTPPVAWFFCGGA